MPWYWTGGERRRTQAAVAQARAEAYQAGREAGWHDAETHFVPRLIAYQRQVAMAEQVRLAAVERARVEGFLEGEAFGRLDNAAWVIRQTAGKRAS